ncbi:MAG TPA: DUF1697 domain-containing protein [Streptosporangiaceae bacterium]|jgi:uncharacterized protein (DUF1697 family)
MATHIALLRGINVGGKNRVAMPALREVVTSLGHADVTTYIQSGNVVFSTGETDTAALAAALEKAIAAELGVPAAVVVLSRAELAAAVDANPYPDEPNPKFVHAVFLPREPAAEMADFVAAAQQAAAQKGSRDTARLTGRVLYLHTPDGLGRSELAVQLGKARGPMAARQAGTARNWATLTRLLALCDT